VISGKPSIFSEPLEHSTVKGQRLQRQTDQSEPWFSSWKILGLEKLSEPPFLL
jgi:hypothetical protein